jgi:hypothetical protein
LPCSINVRGVRALVVKSLLAMISSLRPHDFEQLLCRTEATQRLQSRGRFAVASWLLVQIATQVFPFFEIPNWAVRLVVLLLIAGFPVALVFSWAFEITPEGIKRESEIESDKSITHHTGRNIVALTIVLAVVATGLLIFQFVRPRSTSPSAATISNKSIAVLPFADIHLGLGEKEKALDWLEKSYQDQESASWYLKVDPIYDSVRNNPRFQALVAKIFGSNR